MKTNTKNAFKFLFAKTVSLVILSFIIISCDSSIYQERDVFPFLERQTLMTKSITDGLSAGIDSQDVVNYLNHRMKITSDRVLDISRFDLAEDVYMYVVNLKDGHWYLFSGDYSSDPILAEGEGKFAIENNQSYHQKIWFDSIMNYLRENRDSNSEKAQNNRSEWICSQRIAALKSESSRFMTRDGGLDTSDFQSIIVSDTLANDNYLPLTVTSWHQVEPFNNAAPLASGTNRCPVGCAVTAIAQLLYYTHYTFGFPNYIYASASCSSYYNQAPYNYSFSSLTSSTWSYMEPDPFDLPDNDPYTAALCAYISKMSGTYYDVDNSGYYGATPPGNIAATLSFFSLTGATPQDFLNGSVINEIFHDRPVLCGGYGSSDYSEPHTYLVDGFKRLQVRDTEIVTDLNGNIVSQNIINEYTNIKWYINTGWYPSYPHILIAEGSYIAYDRTIYIGWSQN